jgi:putative ABC transport system permease protein
MPLQTIQARIRALFAKRGWLDAEMDEEMGAHIDMQTEANIEAGMTEAEARRAAFREFGHLDGIKETCREQRESWIGRQLSMTWKDVRFALRQLRGSPGFTTVAIVTLALGIGGSTAIYSVLNNVVLNPVPGPEPDRLLQIAERTYIARDDSYHFFGVSPPVLEGLRANQDFFAEFAFYDHRHMERQTEDFVESVQCTFVSPNFFKLWDVAPILGRTFAEDEAVPLDVYEQPAKDSVIVLKHSWWKSFFDGDREVLGKTIELSGRHFTVIGVMPEYFGFPWGRAEFWVPTEDLRVERDILVSANTRVLARLKPGTTEGQAQAMLDTVAQQVTQNYANTYGYPDDWSRRPGGLELRARPLRHEFQDGGMGENLRQTLFGLLAAIGFVLLIVCANVATLTLARGERRQQEFAVRTALGAGRTRLMRQVLTESVLLGCLGGLGGLIVTHWSIQILITLAKEMPRLRPVEVDLHVLGVAFLLSLATGVVFGLVPTWRASTASLGDAVKQAGTMATAGIWRSRYRDALVVVQVALALVLLAGAGLMIQSVVRLLQVDPGYNTENLLRVSVRLPFEKYSSFSSPDLTNQTLTELHERIASLPGVRAVGVYKDSSESLELEGPEGSIRVGLRGCGLEESDLFDAMGVALLGGRLLDKSDLEEGFFFQTDGVEGVSAVVINQTMANLFWPGQDPVGKSFSSTSPHAKRTYEVVGVVADVRTYRYSETIGPIFYRPYQELLLQGESPMFLIRIATDPGTLAPAIRRELIAAEPGMRTPHFGVVSQTLYDSTLAQRTFMTYLIVFAAVGLLLSAIGIYGVLAYSVARRTREIGIRMAVGSGRGRVVALVMTEGVRLIAVGMGVGLVAAFWLTRFLEHQLFEVSRGEPVVFAGVALLLFVVGLVACLLPALRATRIEPMTALRYE